MSREGPIFGRSFVVSADTQSDDLVLPSALRTGFLMSK
jgi:hypothetical protein